MLNDTNVHINVATSRDSAVRLANVMNQLIGAPHIPNADQVSQLTALLRVCRAEEVTVRTAA